MSPIELTRLTASPCSSSEETTGHPAAVGAWRDDEHGESKDAAKLLSFRHTKYFAQASTDSLLSTGLSFGSPAPPVEIRGGRRHRAVRRGPMDEMRQLVRILVKIFPQSSAHLVITEDGGGNRIDEAQIKHFLDSLLGDAPRPEWGLPRGWAAYVAVLFIWASGREFTEDQARDCAKRLPGRSWEAVESVLESYNLRTHTWKLPLKRGPEAIDGLHIITESKDSAKSSLKGDEPQPKRQRTQVSISKADTLPEAEVWQLLHSLVKVANTKHNSTPMPERSSLMALKHKILEMVNSNITATVALAPTAGAQHGLAPEPGATSQHGSHGMPLGQISASGASARTPAAQLSAAPVPSARPVSRHGEGAGTLHRPVATSAAPSAFAVFSPGSPSSVAEAAAAAGPQTGPAYTEGAQQGKATCQQQLVSMQQVAVGGAAQQTSLGFGGMSALQLGNGQIVYCQAADMPQLLGPSQAGQLSYVLAPQQQFVLAALPHSVACAGSQQQLGGNMIATGYAQAMAAPTIQQVVH